MTKPIDPELLEAMAQHRTSRRRFLGMGGLALGGLAMGPTLLAACSSDSSSSGGGSSDGITVLNWPLYIEGDEPSTSATLKGFTTKIAIIDMVWGTFLSASVSAASVWILRLLKI